MTEDNPGSGSRTDSFVRLAPLLVLLVSALVVRLWSLGSIPTAFFHDECDNAVNVIQILQGRGPGLFGLDWKPQPALGVHEIAASVWLGGPSVRSIRLPSALASVLALVPFVLLARRVAGMLPALLAAALLAFHPGYLHYSRAGWENVQICLWTLWAMEASTRGAETGRFLPWAAAGVLAGLSAMIYFAGRATIVLLALFAGWHALWGWRSSPRAALAPLSMLVAFAVVASPIAVTAYGRWDDFTRRTRVVAFTQELPDDAGFLDVAKALAQSTGRAVRMLWDGSMSDTPRYFIPGKPLLDPMAQIVFFLGAFASCFVWRRTAIWWLALLVPLVLTQTLVSGQPNLARGIGILPVLFLFVALGFATFLRAAGKWRSVAFAMLVAFTLLGAYRGAQTYFAWATSPALRGALEPAVELSEFDEWWEFQNGWIAEGRGFFDVKSWLERKRTAGAAGR